MIAVPMARRKPYALIYDVGVKGHLRSIDAKHHSLIRKAIEQQLSIEPDRETRNRKPLIRPVPFGAQWELRLGPDNHFRVFYEVVPNEREVHVLAIGVKVGNRLRLGGQEVQL